MKREAAWYVVFVMTGTEEEVAGKLDGAGMQAAAPVQVLYERRHGKWWPVRRVVFPGYVFIHAALTNHLYYFITHQAHVHRLLGGGEPQAVPEEQMQVVLFFANEGRDFGVSQGEKSGGRTVVTSGPLVKLQEHILKVNARSRRATVEVPLLDRTIQVDAAIIVSQPDKPSGEAGTSTPEDETR